MTVTGVGSAADYRRCLNYLQGISVVDGVTIVAAQPGTVTFRLSLSALPRYLEQTIESGGVLERTDVEGAYLLAGADPDDA